MKILITGGAGFIGSHLAESLAAEGRDIRCLVKPGGDISYISHLGAEIVYGDLRDIASLKKAVRGADEVYHLGAVSKLDANVPSVEYEEVNVAGTRNILEASRTEGVKRILYTSSMEAVGLSKDGRPLNENTEPFPRNIYGRSKLEGEKAVREYHNRYNTDAVIVRIPMIYGPRNLLHLKRLFKTVKRGYYPVVGWGGALMEFCYVKNAVHGLRLAMEKGEDGHIYFISDERSYRFREVILAIADELGVNLKLLSMPPPAATAIGFSFEVLSRFLKFYPFTFEGTGRPAFSRDTVSWMARNALFCDTSKAKRDLGYAPKYTMREGIRDTIEWYKTIGVL